MKKLTTTLVSPFTTRLSSIKYQPQIHQIFNENISLQCGDIHTKFILCGPGHSIGEQKKLYIKNKKPLIIKCIHKDQRYIKGNTYYGYGLNLKEFNRLCSWDCRGGAGIVMGNGQEGLRIERIDCDKDMKQITQQNTQTSDKNTEPPKPPSVSLPKPMLKFHLQTAHPQKSPITFEMTEQSFQSIQNILKQAIPVLYGVKSEYEIQLDNLVDRFERGEIQDQEEAEYNRFRL